MRPSRAEVTGSVRNLVRLLRFLGPEALLVAGCIPMRHRVAHPGEAAGVGRGLLRGSDPSNPPASRAGWMDHSRNVASTMPCAWENVRWSAGSAGSDVSGLPRHGPDDDRNPCYPCRKPR